MIVYWSCMEKERVRSTQPVSILKKYLKNHIYDSNNPKLNQNLCPSIKNGMKNLYGLTSIYDYSFNIEDNGYVRSDMYDQNFFDDHIMIRSINDKFFSFFQRFYFFTEEDTLNTTFYIPPFLENNFISNNTYSPIGNFDIGKWFRNTEFPFYLKNEASSFQINQGDIYTYIRFETDKKIEFQQFDFSEEIEYYSNLVNNSRFNMKISGNINNHYSFFSNSKIKKSIIKAIKKNLLV